jgi:hypothetical protein
MNASRTHTLHQPVMQAPTPPMTAIRRRRAKRVSRTRPYGGRASRLDGADVRQQRPAPPPLHDPQHRVRLRISKRCDSSGGSWGEGRGDDQGVHAGGRGPLQGAQTLEPGRHEGPERAAGQGGRGGQPRPQPRRRVTWCLTVDNRVSAGRQAGWLASVLRAREHAEVCEWEGLNGACQGACKAGLSGREAPSLRCMAWMVLGTVHLRVVCLVGEVLSPPGLHQPPPRQTSPKALKC